MISVHFYKADSLLGRLVGKFGKTEYVHCAIQIDGKHIIETDAFKKLQLKHLYKKPSKVIYLNIDEKKVITNFNLYMNAQYDYNAVLEFLGLSKQNGQKFTCVEACFAMIGWEIKNITPDGFYKELYNKVSCR